MSEKIFEMEDFKKEFFLSIHQPQVLWLGISTI
jgi:hypothetical protein